MQSLQGLKEKLKGPSGDHKVVPAVELHMFPIDPMNVSSTWKVLLVPTAQEVFGERLYLCNPNSVQTSATLTKSDVFPHHPLVHHLEEWNRPRCLRMSTITKHFTINSKGATELETFDF